MENDRNKQNEAASRISRAMLFVLFLCSVAVTVLLSFPELFSFGDDTFFKLFSETVPRFAVSVFLFAMLFTTEEYRRGVIPGRKGALRALLWSIPCFFVALVNFPYTALASGSARILRTDLLWLFLAKCLSVALLEELFFRALLVPFVRVRMKGNLAAGLTVLITAVVFGLSHLINLFFGGGVLPTLLQTGYTFLLGCMFAVMFLKTGNVWLCVLVHFIFDVGGVIVTDLGSGPFQDTVFWILTVAAGLICAVHIACTIFRIMKAEAAPREEQDGT